MLDIWSDINLDGEYISAGYVGGKIRGVEELRSRAPVTVICEISCEYKK